jgi:hypothetical protein
MRGRTRSKLPDPTYNGESRFEVHSSGFFQFELGAGEWKLDQKSYYSFYKPSLFWILNGYKKKLSKKKFNFSSKAGALLTF